MTLTGVREFKIKEGGSTLLQSPPTCCLAGTLIALHVAAKSEVEDCDESLMTHVPAGSDLWRQRCGIWELQKDLAVWTTYLLLLSDWV